MIVTFGSISTILTGSSEIFRSVPRRPHSGSLPFFTLTSFGRNPDHFRLARSHSTPREVLATHGRHGDPNPVREGAVRRRKILTPGAQAKPKNSFTRKRAAQKNTAPKPRRIRPLPARTHDDTRSDSGGTRFR
uniref:(northern house mosquito) hypothetical protein n=1 Tax=Culex pipiens TaxID=7175 RepID=A0A8D8I6A2_CULPI